MRSAPLRVMCLLAAFTGSGLLVSGCQPKPLSPPLTSPGSRTIPAAPVTPAFSSAHVQSLPLYQQAQKDCARQQYRQAADALARLASDKTLSAPEQVFCQEQRTLCLKDAGLPAATHKASVPLSPTVSPISSAKFTPEQANCGPRALLLVCEKLGVHTTLPILQQGAGTTTQGTSMAGLTTAAKQVGLKAEGVQVSREALPQQPLPAIAYVNGNHFIVVLKLQGEGENATATIHDPNDASAVSISQEQLLRQCSGYLLLLHR